MSPVSRSRKPAKKNKAKTSPGEMTILVKHYAPLFDFFSSNSSRFDSSGADAPGTGSSGADSSGVDSSGVDGSGTDAPGTGSSGAGPVTWNGLDPWLLASSLHDKLISPDRMAGMTPRRMARFIASASRLKLPGSGNMLLAMAALQ